MKFKDILSCDKLSCFIAGYVGDSLLDPNGSIDSFVPPLHLLIHVSSLWFLDNSLWGQKGFFVKMQIIKIYVKVLLKF